eukprot:TRINITY_DN94818_c0_g1_i1.p2 TRINITY_DN94818_c0_g1~~TRINITY_DN94818_c0_g1_i1.p2  ORF type:complete len:323 (-),score=61.20 TRINITY_DN94818_c0_g1_i1:84-1031(-)
MLSSMRLAVLALLGATASNAAPLTFFSLGDWGGQTVSAPIKASQTAVAAQMAAQAAHLKPKFVINVGDNFYDNGVTSTTDPLWKTDFQDVYNAAGLQVPWYSILGNHDYGLNPGCQTEYKADSRWVMPSRYFTQKEGDITFVFLDTNPCIKAYRSTSPSGWDPNTTQFHENIVAQDCQTQVTWLNAELAKVPKSDFLIIVGHHPVYDIDEFDFPPLLEKYGVDLYICGHNHMLELYHIDNSPLDHIISGAGCRVHLNATDADRLPQNPLYATDIIWQEKVAGFATHTLNDAGTALKTEFIDYKGNVIYTVTSHKR